VSEDWVESIRKDFPALQNRRGGRPPVYFDNACTTLVPRQVIETIDEYYRDFPGCGGERSRYWFAEEVNSRIEGNPEKGIKGSRRIIRDYINAASGREILFTQNTTHAINLVALGFKFRPGDIVLLSGREHNSNLIPWLRLQKSGKIRVEHIDSDESDSFDLDTFKVKLENNNVRLVSLASTSNLTGVTLPIREIIRTAHDFGARVLLDGAQTVPHRTIDVRELDVDFLAFSIHKMCGPRGVGVLYAKKELLGQGEHEEDTTGDAIDPVILGGGTIGDSTYDSYTLLEPPERFEAGVQNYPAQIAAGTTLEYLQSIGMDRIADRERQLNTFLTEQLLDRYGNTGWFRILGPEDAGQRGGILTFDVKRPNAVGIADELDKNGNVMIRDGAFCVHSYLNCRFGEGWTRPALPTEHRMTYRVSLYFYNTMEECRIFLETLHNIFKERSYI